MNFFAGQCVGGNGEHAMRRLIGHEDGTAGIGREDGSRTAFNEDPQLLFSFASSFALTPNFIHVLKNNFAVSADFAHEQTGAEEGSKEEHVSGDAGPWAPLEIAEKFSEKGA